MSTAGAEGAHAAATEAAGGASAAAPAGGAGSAEVGDLLELEHVIGYTGRAQNTLHCHPARDGEFVCSLGANVVIGHVDDPHRQEFLRAHDEEVSAVVVSPSGALVASGQRGSTRSAVSWVPSSTIACLRGLVRRVRAATPTHALPAPHRLHCDPWQGGEAPVVVWDYEARRQVFNLFGIKGSVARLAFAPDDQFLAAAGEDGLLFIWDMQVCVVCVLREGTRG